MIVRIEVKTEKGVISYESPDINPCIEFLMRLNSLMPRQSAQAITQTQTTQTTQSTPTASTQTIQTTQPTQSTQPTLPTQSETRRPRRVISERAYEEIQAEIQGLSAFYGSDTVNNYLNEVGIKIDRNMTQNQLRRAYALLRRKFPEYFKALH